MEVKKLARAQWLKGLQVRTAPDPCNVNASCGLCFAVTQTKALWGYWLEIDRVYAERQFTAVLHAEDCWIPKYGILSSIDDVKISKSAQTLTALLMALNSKYRAIRSVEVLEAFVQAIHCSLIGMQLKVRTALTYDVLAMLGGDAAKPHPTVTALITRAPSCRPPSPFPPYREGNASGMHWEILV